MKNKNIREKGKIRFSEYFKELKEGDRVAIVSESSIDSSFPIRIIGKSGNVVGERGLYKLVAIRDGNKMKTFIIHPIHLKKLK
ncbi:MAG: 50S ribosomal protein L21e [Nanoarchaeota archaeon]